MPDLGPWEIVIIAIVVLVLFGAKKLPDSARALGRSLRIFKAETKGLRGDDDTQAAPTTTHAPPQAAPPPQQLPAGGQQTPQQTTLHGTPLTDAQAAPPRRDQATS